MAATQTSVHHQTHCYDTTYSLRYWNHQRHHALGPGCATAFVEAWHLPVHAWPHVTACHCTRMQHCTWHVVHCWLEVTVKPTPTVPAMRSRCSQVCGCCCCCGHTTKPVQAPPPVLHSRNLLAERWAAPRWQQEQASGQLPVGPATSPHRHQIHPCKPCASHVQAFRCTNARRCETHVQANHEAPTNNEDSSVGCVPTHGLRLGSPRHHQQQQGTPCLPQGRELVQQCCLGNAESKL